MKSFSELIDKFGGAPAFADKIGIPASHARTMKARDSIPPEHWPAVIAAAQVSGDEPITMEQLLMLRAARKTAVAA